MLFYLRFLLLVSLYMMSILQKINQKIESKISKIQTQQVISKKKKRVVLKIMVQKHTKMTMSSKLYENYPFCKERSIRDMISYQFLMKVTFVDHILFKTLICLINTSNKYNMSTHTVNNNPEQIFTNKRLFQLPRLQNKKQYSAQKYSTITPTLSKAKTQTSEQSQQKSSHVKTQSNYSSKDSNTSQRLLSKFIENHIQKRICFQQKNYFDQQNRKKDYDSTSFLSQEKHNINEDNFTVIRKVRQSEHLYGYQKTNFTGFNEFQFEQMRKKQKLKNKFLLKNKQYRKSININKLMSESFKQSPSNIDAYFDLSCLKRIRKDQQNNREQE